MLNPRVRALAALLNKLFDKELLRSDMQLCEDYWA